MIASSRDSTVACYEIGRGVEVDGAVSDDVGCGMEKDEKTAGWLRIGWK